MGRDAGNNINVVMLLNLFQILIKLTRRTMATLSCMMEMARIGLSGALGQKEDGKHLSITMEEGTS